MEQGRQSEDLRHFIDSIRSFVQHRLHTTIGDMGTFGLRCHPHPLLTAHLDTRTLTDELWLWQSELPESM